MSLNYRHTNRPVTKYEVRFFNLTIPNYDVRPDGQRFVMVRDESASGRLNVVVSWVAELKRVTPASRP
jgi:hypothetical protein